MDAPLKGVKVLEIAVMLSAPYAGMMLRDFGAEVVKVEDPGAGDQSRHWPPAAKGLGLIFARANAGKKSIAVNLRDARGQELIRQLVRDSDIVLENFRPGRMAAWNLGFDTLRQANPRVVLVHVSGYGQTGPYKDLPGFGSVAEAESGFAFVNGWKETPPTIAPFGLGDSIAAMAAAYGSLTALRAAERTGEAQEVDVALYEPIMAVMGDVMLRYAVNGQILERGGFDITAPRGVYQTSDGKWLMIAGSSQSIVERIFVAVGRPELNGDPDYATHAARIANREAVEKVVRDWVAQRPRDEALEILRRHEVACGPVNDSADVVADPGYRERGSVIEVDSPRFGRISYPGPMFKVRNFEGVPYADAPEVGEHTVGILRERLGKSDAELEELRQANVISGPVAMAGPVAQG
jgi:crotonobetainyl-CoA:carnitine CoA-transferase CaiB-like acyl-CoA transferase